MTNRGIRTFRQCWGELGQHRRSAVGVRAALDMANLCPRGQDLPRTDPKPAVNPRMRSLSAPRGPARQPAGFRKRACTQVGFIGTLNRRYAILEPALLFHSSDTSQFGSGSVNRQYGNSCLPVALGCRRLTQPPPSPRKPPLGLPRENRRTLMW